MVTSPLLLGFVLAKRRDLPTREAIKAGALTQAMGASTAGIVVANEYIKRQAERETSPPPEPAPVPGPDIECEFTMRDDAQPDELVRLAEAAAGEYHVKARPWQLSFTIPVALLARVEKELQRYAEHLGGDAHGGHHAALTLPAGVTRARIVVHANGGAEPEERQAD